MANTWRAENLTEWDDPIVFRSCDFDPVELYETLSHGRSWPVYVYDQTDGNRPVCVIEEREGRPYVQPLDGDTGERIPLRIS